jgi:hypothetical protein
VYGIMRFKKLKTMGNVGGVCAHHSRTRQTPNADPLRTPENIWLAGKPASLVDTLTDRLRDIRVRKNAVIAVEFLLTASPEYFRQIKSEYGEYDINKVQEFNQHAMTWLVNTFKAENILSAVCHFDEATPHVHAVIIPVDPKGKLNSTYWFDGRKKLSDLQDSFSEAVKPIGLNRGIKGSKSTHTTIKQYYECIESVKVPDSPKIEISTPPAMMRESSRKDWAREESERLTGSLAGPMMDLSAQAGHARMARRRADQERKTAEAATREAAALRERASRLRSLDLALVAARLGMKKRHGLWFGPTTSEYGIRITESKFYDHGLGKGGGGAIDLAMHTLDVDYSTAVAELAALFDSPSLAADAAATAYEAATTTVKASVEAKAAKIISIPPEPYQEHLEAVRGYLVDKRSIPASLVDAKIRAGQIYADRQGNVVFRYGKYGAELRGTFGGKWHGFRGSKAAGFVVGQRPKNGGWLVLVESAIDALSYCALGLIGDAVVALGGVPRGDRLDEIVKVAKKHGYGIIGAFDADDAGQEAQDRLRDACMGYDVVLRRQELPRGCKDWNEALIIAERGVDAPHTLAPGF